MLSALENKKSLENKTDFFLSSNSLIASPSHIIWDSLKTCREDGFIAFVIKETREI